MYLVEVSVSASPKCHPFVIQQQTSTYDPTLPCGAALSTCLAVEVCTPCLLETEADVFSDMIRATEAEDNEAEDNEAEGQMSLGVIRVAVLRNNRVV